MKCLTYAECKLWCEHFGYSVGTDSAGRPRPQYDFSCTPRQWLEFPADSGRKVALARTTIGFQSGGEEMRLWLDDWAVWPSAQHMPLFERFRQSFGETRPLIEAPGQVFRADELEDAISVLSVALFFMWDCHVFAGDRGSVFFTSHDEVCYMIGRNENYRNDLAQAFESFLEE